MAVDSNGTMYLACPVSQGSNVSSIIVVLDSNGNFVQNITMSKAWYPFGISFGNSLMYVTSLWDSVVYALNPSTFAVVNSWSSGGLFWPWGVEVGGDGNVYVANYGQGNVIKYSSTGTWMQNFSTTNPAMYFPEEVAIDSSNNVYVVDTDNDRIVKFNSAGTVLATYNQTTPALNEPGGIVLDSQGSIYVCDTWNYAVVKLNSVGQQIEVLSDALADGTVKVSAAAGLAIFKDQVYVVDSISNNRILKFPPQLIGSNSATSGASSCTLTFLVALVALLALAL
jgi:sugar lactone lactonase YvrE